MTTVKERLDLVRRTTICPTNTAFAEWVEANSSQVVSGWEARDSISSAGALKVARATGADLHWLLTGEGDPFPTGAKLYPGALPTDALNRLRMTEDAVDALMTVMGAAFRTMAAENAALGTEMAQALGSLRGSSGSQRQVYEAAVLALAAGLRSSVLAARSAAPAASGKKRSRTDR